ncbi:hypothetical protein [Plebeiibacterium sediminum]|uniref:Uncharacterized protein n=1 Tax=Plebeiibacterium sediminum TaxID=2992112 RepID=A0AAE3SHB3_9BACT|nr:hypothetical protein [Plebeiobacterium sediminum]MCW3789373.1 hypothetical protein [Plebeiobacterium sediminum]
MKNLHQSSIPQEVLTEALNKLNEVNSILSPYLLTVTKDDRRGLAKMGNKSLAFVTEANEYSKQNPNLRPAFTSQEDFDIDVADATGLLPVSGILEKLLSQVEDTSLVAGSEALNHALLFYNNTKLAAKNGVAGAQEITNSLSTRFTRRKRKNETSEE